MKPHSLEPHGPPGEMRTFVEAERKEQVLGKQQYRYNRGSLFMAFGSTCWGFDLGLKEKERSWWRCYRNATGKHILLLRSTKNKASLQVSLHLWGNWASRLGCWEHICLLASCQVWPLFFYIFLMITKRTHDKIRKLGGKIWKQSSQKRLGEVREAEAWAVRPRLESAPSCSSVVLGVTNSP